MDELYLHCRTCIKNKADDFLEAIVRKGFVLIMCDGGGHDGKMLVAEIKADTDEIMGRGCSSHRLKLVTT